MPESSKVLYMLTNNEHKLREARSILSEHGIELRRLEGVEKLEIQHEDLGEIARRAALEASRSSPLPLVVEDAGLYIYALKGFPGPYSSFACSTLGLQGILKLMEGLEGDARGAEFRAALAYGRDGRVKLFEGRVRGRIAPEAKGWFGFGFDPIFIPEGEVRTFAEMSSEEKNRVSHRGKAFRALASWLSSKPQEGLFHQ